MKKIFIGIAAIAYAALQSCTGPSIETLDSGMIISWPDTSGNRPRKLKVEVMDHHIIHIAGTPEPFFTEDTSLAVIRPPGNDIPWEAGRRGKEITLTTDSLQVRINKQSGAVGFYRVSGERLLQEPESGAKRFSPTGKDGLYSIQQAFEPNKNEALYGLGQFQNGLMDLSGRNVDLIQHNLVAVNPYLVSTGNFGLLWDNYSITRFGDPRKYKELSGLNLWDIEGEEGYLTVSYYQEADHENPYRTEKEKTIDIRYLDDIDQLPGDFDMENGRVVWEGTLQSHRPGEHFMRVYSSGTMKVYINGTLIQDNWREGWNPWFLEHIVNWQEGERKSLKVEWIPVSGQAFADITWLDALPADERQAIRFSSESGKSLNYYFVAGASADQVIAGFRHLTGKAPLFPKWSYGFWQSRERYTSQQELLDVAREFRRREIPIDNIVLDWFYWPENRWGSHTFDKERFPDPNEMIRQLHEELDMQLMISVWPKFYENTDNFKQMDRKGWIYRRNIENRQKDWVGYVSSFYDAFNPEARDAYWKGIRDQLHARGIDAWWMDATEPDILSNASVKQRKALMNPTYLGPATNYFNAYSLVHTSGVHKGLRQADPEKRIFILTRSAFAGQQRYSAATWSGDVASRWNDLHMQIAGGVNFCMAGIPYWTHDIGGFLVEKRYHDATGEDLAEWRELMTRWFQFGTFSPLMRVHGQYPYREMFNVAPEHHRAYRSMLYYDRLRYRLMPYIYSLAGKVYHNDYTLMRGLAMDFAHDRMALDINDQYMFGPTLMINPVHRYKARNRHVYLPAGQGWYDLYTGSYHQGGVTLDANAPYQRIPVFAREGSILVTGQTMEYTGQKRADTLNIIVYTGDDAAFSLYEDEGYNTDYREGAYTKIPVKYREKEGSLQIGNRVGEYPGMINDRVFRVTFVTRTQPVGIDELSGHQITIRYTGNPVTIDSP